MKEKYFPTKPIVFISGLGIKPEIIDALNQFAEVRQWKKPFAIPAEVMREEIRQADILILAFESVLDREMIQEGKHLKLVIQNFVGYERADIAACTEYGIPFCNAAAPSSYAVAEMALALILASSRRITDCVQAVRDGKWVKEWKERELKGRHLRGETAGILGMGHIGTVLAGHLQQLGMTVIYHNRKPVSHDEEQRTRYVPLDRLCGESDVLINILPASSSTRHMIDLSFFQKMKPTALFVNVGRGSTVVTEDLATALQKGYIERAAIDVCDPEPLPADHPLMRQPNIIITPHMSSSTDTTRLEKGRQLIQNVKNAINGKPLTDCVNQEALERNGSACRWKEDFLPETHGFCVCKNTLIQ